MSKKKRRNKQWPQWLGSGTTPPSTAPAKSASATKTASVTRTPENVVNFKLVIPDEIYQAIMYLLKKSKNEISGFGDLEFDEKEKVFKVVRLRHVKHLERSPTSCTICPGAIGKAMFEAKDEPYGLKWHWHTHPNMDVFWSSDDMEIIRSLGQQEWIVATVFNDSSEYRTAFYTTTEVMGFKHDVFKDEIDTTIERYLSKEFCDDLDAKYLAIQPDVNPVVMGESYWGEDYVGGLYTEYDDYYKKDDQPFVYDANGYCKSYTGVWLYNPVKDRGLFTQNERMDAIGEMEQGEIVYLKWADNEFKALLDQYMIREANKPNLEVKSERNY